MKNLMLFVLSRPILNGLILGAILGAWRFLSGELNSGNFDRCVVFSLLVAAFFTTLVFLFRKKYVTAPGIYETLIKVDLDNKVVDVVDAKRKNIFKKAIWGNEKTEIIYRFSESFDMDAKKGDYDWDKIQPKSRSFTLKRKTTEPQSGLTVPIKIKFHFKEDFEMQDWQAVVDKIIVPAKKFPNNYCSFLTFIVERLALIKKDLDAANSKEIKKFRENQISFEILKKNISKAFYNKLMGLMSLSFIYCIGIEIGVPSY